MFKLEIYTMHVNWPRCGDPMSLAGSAGTQRYEFKEADDLGSVIVARHIVIPPDKKMRNTPRRNTSPIAKYPSRHALCPPQTHTHQGVGKDDPHE